MTTITDPATEARRLYAPKLRRAEVISLCTLFIHDPKRALTFARSLIEGPDAPVKGKAYGAPTRLVKGERVATARRYYFDREAVLAACVDG